MLLQLRIIFHTDLSSDWQSSELCYFRRGASHNNGGGGEGGDKCNHKLSIVCSSFSPKHWAHLKLLVLDPKQRQLSVGPFPSFLHASLTQANTKMHSAISSSYGNVITLHQCSMRKKKTAWKN